LFNVIKGNLINKNVKSVVISTDRNKVEENNKNIKKEFETLDEIQEKSEELFFEHEEKMEYETESETERLENIIENKRVELENIQVEAVKTIKDAEKKAKEILENAINDANSEVNDIKANAWEEGFNRGKQEAMQRMEEDVDAVLISANKVLTESSIKAREIFQDNKSEIIKLSFEIAKKIIKKEVSDKEVLFENLVEAMKKAQSNKELKIFVNWEQLSFGKEIKDILKNNFQGIETIDIIEDRTVEPGGCIIETKLGKIDATIKNQLDIVFNALIEE
jgi:flagellar assembly protein FliH